MSKYKSGVMVLVDPSEIVLGKNTRWEGLDLDRVEEYAVSFEQHGQRQPVTCRHIGGDQIQLVFGFHRHAAAIRYNERNPEKQMKLKVIVVSCNEEEALRYAVVENKHRKATNPMDDAVNQRRFREEFGWDNTKLAELYQCSVKIVGDLEKLLILPNDVQRSVASRAISVKAAIDLAELSPADQKEVLSQTPAAAVQEMFDDDAELFKRVETPHGNGKPTPSLGARVASKVRERKIDAGGAKARTVADVKKLFEQIGEESKVKGVQELAELMAKVLKGSIKDGAVRKKLEVMF